MAVTLLTSRYMNVEAEREVASLVRVHDVKASIELNLLSDTLKRKIQLSIKRGYYPAVTGQGVAVYAMLCDAFGLTQCYRGANRGVFRVRGEHAQAFCEEVTAISKLVYKANGGDVQRWRRYTVVHCENLYDYDKDAWKSGAPGRIYSADVSLVSGMTWEAIGNLFEQYVIHDNPDSIDAAVAKLVRGDAIEVRLSPTRYYERSTKEAA